LRLRGAPSGLERAQAVLGFLCTATDAAGGHLFLVRSAGTKREELALVCSSLESDGSAELLEAATQVWNRELDRPAEDNRTKTLEASSLEMLREAPACELWRDAKNVVFEHRLLGVYRIGQWTPVGIALLKTEVGRALGPLHQGHMDALCNALLDET
jgi:hypothetical protein